MRVLLVHHGDFGFGGGQIQMYRLLLGLRRAGVDTQILCKAKTRDDSIAMRRWPRVEALLGKVTTRLGLNDIHYFSSFLIKQSQAYRDADILDFHCIHSGFFSYLALPGLTADKPAVFTLHDMWPFTGHCHNSRDCMRWQTGCGKCPYPEIEPAIQRDATRLEWKLKNWVYQHSQLTLVTPSQWMTAQAKLSMLSQFPIYHIPHGIDTKLYKPHDPIQCRSLLGIPPDKYVLLFVVDRLDRYLKGGDLLQQALQSLPATLKTNLTLLLLGNKGEALARSIDIPTVDLGFVLNDRLKTICYSAADLFVFPTRVENFPLVVLESMACGTPVVSYRVGGVPDVVRPGVTGYLAEPDNATDLRHGIIQLLEDTPLRQQMGQQARATICAEYTIELQVERYLEVYHQLLQHETVGSRA